MTSIYNKKLALQPFYQCTGLSQGWVGALIRITKNPKIVFKLQFFNFNGFDENSKFKRKMMLKFVGSGGYHDFQFC